MIDKVGYSALQNRGLSNLVEHFGRVGDILLVLVLVLDCILIENLLLPLLSHYCSFENEPFGPRAEALRLSALLPGKVVDKWHEEHGQQKDHH